MVPAGPVVPAPRDDWPRPLALDDASFEPEAVVLGARTGTEAGRQARRLGAELRAVQRDLGDDNQRLQAIRAGSLGNADRYQELVTAISTALAGGATPGDAALRRQLRGAYTMLERIAGSVADMNDLSTTVSGRRPTVIGIAGSARAAEPEVGTADADRRQLALVNAGARHTARLLERMLGAISQDISRQNSHLAAERDNLQILQLAVANGEPYGISLANRAFVGATASPARPVAPGRGDRPLVVIRFDRPDVHYQQPLYRAVSLALERRPSAVFTLVAVSPAGAADRPVAVVRDHAEDVKRALIDMGLPPEQVFLTALASPDLAGGEVRLYVR